MLVKKEKPLISVIILTLNESGILSSCLKALSDFHEVHIVDSGSQDATIEIARNVGAHVYSHAFESFGKQRNWALENCQIQGDWVLFLDADEMATDNFKQAVLDACDQAEDNVAGFYLCNRMILENTWLKRSSNFPTWQFRLHRKGRANFSDFGHGQKEGCVDGEILYIEKPYDHYPFYKGWSDWFEKHNRYSTQEAKTRLNAQLKLRDIFSKKPTLRNSALKQFLTQIPGWPVIRFVGAYFMKLGFLDGRSGFIYCFNMAWYEYWIKLKIRELKRNK